MKEDIKNEKYIKNSPIPVSLENTEKIINQMKKCVCQIHKEGQGTGFLCKIPYPDASHLLPVLVTNNHVLNSDDIKENKIITISFNNKQIVKTIKIDNTRKKFNSEELDVTFIEIKENKDGIYDFLELEDNINENEDNLKNLYKNKSIYILNYPEEKNIVVSYGMLLNIKNEQIIHQCITKGGSSGSPILSLDNFKIIGIHCGASITNNYNFGIFIKYPIIEFNNSNLILDNPKNEMTIIYEVEDYNKTIRIFGENFVKNNKNNCKLIINGKEQEIAEYLTIDDNIKKIIIEKNLVIRLKEIKTITDMSCLFSFCFSLKSLPDISKWNTENVINMRSLFRGCQKLYKLPDISNWNTKNVTDMSYMFCSCGVNYLPDISKWNIENVKNLSWMFAQPRIGHADAIYFPDISKWNTKNVNDISYMFYGLSNNYNENFPDLTKWELKNVIKYEYIFFYCNIKYEFNNHTKKLYIGKV